MLLGNCSVGEISWQSPFYHFRSDGSCGISLCVPAERWRRDLCKRRGYCSKEWTTRTGWELTAFHCLTTVSEWSLNPLLLVLILFAHFFLLPRRMVGALSSFLGFTELSLEGKSLSPTYLTFDPVAAEICGMNSEKSSGGISIHKSIITDFIPQLGKNGSNFIYNANPLIGGLPRQRWHR